MTPEQLTGFVGLATLVGLVAVHDWRWLLAPFTFTLIFAGLLWWAYGPSESSGGQHGSDRFRRGEEA